MEIWIDVDTLEVNRHIEFDVLLGLNFLLEMRTVINLWDLEKLMPDALVLLAVAKSMLGISLGMFWVSISRVLCPGLRCKVFSISCVQWMPLF